MKMHENRKIKIQAFLTVKVEVEHLESRVGTDPTEREAGKASRSEHFCGHGTELSDAVNRAEEPKSDSEGILGAVGVEVGKNVPTPTLTSI
jgi:hypothetical protein